MNGAGQPMFVPLTIRLETAAIHLNGGRVSLVDTADWPLLSQYQWSLHTDGGAYRGEYTTLEGEGPVKSRRRHRNVRMHRQIMDAPDGIEVDHKDLDRLNNRRGNLRLATSQQQKCNQGLRQDNTSGVKGVAWDRSRKRWVAYIRKNRRRVTLGRFLDKADAVRVRQSAASDAFGEFARETLHGIV